MKTDLKTLLPELSPGQRAYLQRIIEEEVIGEDEDEDNFRADEWVSQARADFYLPIIARNELRAEQRKRLRVLFEGEEGADSQHQSTPNVLGHEADNLSGGTPR